MTDFQHITFNISIQYLNSVTMHLHEDNNGKDSQSAERV